ncbi:MAG TPA: DUF3168 domain-containing protein [Sphingomicrobium sp.]|jgi:hypothetical protein|nr:DUF3168 domain-containing protein [Sphingomicrobium sp.]
MEAALRARLLGQAAITSIVKKRIDWGDRPQGRPLPAITLELIDDPLAQHMSGIQALQSSLVQIDVWADDYLEAKELMGLVLAELVPAAVQDQVNFGRAFVQRRRATHEFTGADTVYRRSADIMVWHSPAAA